MWREKAFWLLVLLVGCTYFTRIDQPSLRGEETRRARVAQEMLMTGDYIVPRQQGELFLSRPPLQNWVIAAAARMRGNMDIVAVRLPGVVSLLLTCLCIYGYSRPWMSPLGSFAAGASFATMLQVLELGRLAETESLFTLLVAASLFCWHAGHTRGWNPAWNWMASYTLVGLAMLTKGLQPPVYFGGAVGIYLILCGQWRQLFRWQHFAGLAMLASVVAAWQIPFYLETGWSATKGMYIHDVGLRFNDSRWSTALAHWATYPFEVLLCTAPWCLALLFFLSPFVRNAVAAARPCATFMVLCLAVAFPSCWLPPESRGRYFMPLYPCLAILIGLAVEGCWLATPRDAVHRWHLRMQHLTAVSMLVAGIGLAVAATIPAVRSVLLAAMPWWMIGGYTTAAIALFALVEWSLYRTIVMRGSLATLALAAFLAVTYNGPVLSAIGQRSHDIEPQVARLKRQMPPDVSLVSLNSVHHLFAFYYRDAIPFVSLKQGEPIDFTYFCFFQAYDRTPDIPFDWEIVEVIPCDRHRRTEPIDKMVIGRRISDSRSASIAPPPRY
jgi:4-amino-4-deoxy-L-arabinose transferase-like glycosyltransferase